MCSFAGIEPGNHPEQEADLTRVQEVEPEVMSLVSQQQDEASSHNVVTLDQSGTPVLGREYHRFLSNRSGGSLLQVRGCEDISCS